MAWVKVKLLRDYKVGEEFEAIWCPACRKWKDPADFWACASRKTRKQPYCAACQEMKRK